MGNIHTSGPNEALIVSGGCIGGSDNQKIIDSGGWAWAWWFVTGKFEGFKNVNILHDFYFLKIANKKSE